jgi:hypothetical protein
VPQVGFLEVMVRADYDPAKDPTKDALLEGLQALGCVEGKNILCIARRSATTHSGSVHRVALELRRGRQGQRIKTGRSLTKWPIAPRQQPTFATNRHETDQSTRSHDVC